MTKTKRIVAMLLAVVMLFTFVSVIAACQPQDECEKNGHTLTPVAKKEATTEEAGYEAYWKCSVCNKLFSDSEGKNEITKPVEIPKLTPEPGPQPEQHVCKHICPTCSKCTDSTCTDPVCADKCQGHQTEDKKGLTKDNPLTPEEAIALMDKAGSGKVVDPTNKEGYYIQGVVNAGSTIDTQYHEWTFTIGTGAKTVSCKAKIDSTVTNKPAERNGELDGETVIIKGFLELYSGKYQCAYLPASASPTGAKFTPSIVDIAVQELPPAEVESISIKNGSVDYTDKTVYLLPIDNNAISFVATVEPANAPQDIVWTVENGDKATVTATDGTDETRAVGQVTYKDQTGTITLTATAKGTNISATITVEIRDVKGSKESDPLSVDEAIALMEATPDEYLYADSCRHGFYIQGTVAAGSKQSGAGWSFTLAGSDNKSIACSVESGKLNGITVPRIDGGLDGCEILFYAYTLYKNEDYTSKSNLNELKKCTFPALTAIEIEAASTEVTVPYSVEITVKSITPANAVFENVEWLTSDESKATVSGDTVKATVTTIAAGEVKISVRCANVTSNEITLTLLEEEKAIKAVYDWTKKLTDDVQCNYTLYSVGPQTGDIVDTFINVWSPEQTEILAMSVTNAWTMRDGEGIGFYPGRGMTGAIDITTVHQIKKITLKIIPYSDATMVQFSVNGKEYSEEKGDKTWDGKLTSAIDITLELTEASNTLKFEKNGTMGNQFVIVGMTLESEAAEEEANQLSLDWSGNLTESSIVDNVYTYDSVSDMLAKLNTWSPNQQEITAFTASNLSISKNGQGFGYFALPAMDNSATATFTTTHQIKKITFKVIPFADSTTTQFTVNGVSFKKDKEDSVYNGKLSSAFEAEVELTEASNTLEIQMPWIQKNNFVIVGITLEW